VQHIAIVTSKSAWGFASAAPPLQSGNPFGHVASIYSNARGQWQALSVPYTDLQSIEVVSSSGADVWAVAVYMVTTPIPSGSSSVSHYVLLRYTGGAWTEYGR
jgi:phage baseplate assembly protein gpV